MAPLPASVAHLPPASQALIALLHQHRLTAHTDLGQHFLVDMQILTQIADAAGITKADTVVEIGAGPGMLTRELADRAGHVISIEYDQRFAPVLQRLTRAHPHVQVIFQDIRTFTPPTVPYHVVANIPYYLTSPILRQFYTESPHRPDTAVLLIQREVADKLTNPKKCSVLQLQVSLFADIEFLFPVSRMSFYPPPQVESAVIRIRRRLQPDIPEAQVPAFMRLVHAGFSSPRKKIKTSLAHGLGTTITAVEALLGTAQVSGDLRAEDLTRGDWVRIFGARE